MKVIVTGATGQDGRIISKLPISEEHFLIGATFSKDSHLESLAKNSYKYYLQVDLTNPDETRELIAVTKPDAVIHLAGMSSVIKSWEIPSHTLNSNVISTANLIEAITEFKPDCRFINATSTEIFDPTDLKVNELTRINPQSPYSISKAATYYLCRAYRNQGFKFSNAILANHESEFRSTDFVTGKIAETVAKIYLGTASYLQLGDLNAKRDWSYAGDICRGIVSLMESDLNEDIIFASGVTHSVEDIVIAAFSSVGIQNWKNYVSIDEGYFRKNESKEVRIDPSKSYQLLGWKSELNLNDWISQMVQFNISKFKNLET